MRTVVVANQKGGCGKTTIVINLAACLAREGQRTLVVDLDPQGHCGLGLAVPEEQIEVNIADALLATDNGQVFDVSRVTWQISSNYDLIPAKTNLSQLEQKLAGVSEREARLGKLLQTVQGKYDIAIIDTPPNIGFLTESALFAADEVVVPVDTGYFSLHGLSKQLETIRQMRSRWQRSMTVRILANLYDVRTKLGREILAELRKRHGDAMFTSFINFNTKLKESTSLGQPITEYDPASSGCRDFVRLARELISIGSGGLVASEIRDLQPELRAAEHLSEPTPELLQRADSIAADANRLLATSETLLGSTRQVRTSNRAMTPDETERKIDLIYGAHAISDGAVFVIRAPGAKSVRLAGDFNDWNPSRSPMIPLRDDAFHTRIPLPPGQYRYRYVVDGNWINDPANGRVELNPYGELNSVVVVA